MVNGAVRWNSESLVMILTALSGGYVGFKEEENGVWSIWYRLVHISTCSDRTMQVYEAGTFTFQRFPLYTEILKKCKE
jgi:hypothetical protein